jgi:DNA-directed RNA polymerase beta' subunit
MTEENEWMIQQLQQIFAQTDDYYQRTLIKAAQDIIVEQEKRMDQMEGEMEGTIWSPRKWSE